MITGFKVKFLRGFFAKLRGLEFRRGDDITYFFENCNHIHTFFMKNLIDVAFISDVGYVLKVNNEVRPWSVLKCKEAKHTVERFSSDKLWLQVGRSYIFE